MISEMVWLSTLAPKNVRLFAAMAATFTVHIFCLVSVGVYG